MNDNLIMKHRMSHPGEALSAGQICAHVKQLLSRASALAAATLILMLPARQAVGSGDDVSGYHKLPEDVLSERVNFESTAEWPDQTRLAAEAMARRMVEGDVPQKDVLLINPLPGKYGLIARLRGTHERRPLLTMAHIDAVTADPGAWAFPPFTFSKKEGYYFGRGTQDDKSGAAHLMTSFIRLQQENHVPNRDLILVLTGDEETEGQVINWPVTAGRDLIDAAYALNTDGGRGEYDANFQPQAAMLQTSEKVFQTYELTATNPGGTVPYRARTARSINLPRPW